MMSPYTVVAVVATLLVVQLLVLRRWLDGQPFALWNLLEKERGKDHADALTALHDAAGMKATTLLAGVRSYHEQLAADLRGRAVDAEWRARILERRSAEAAVALEAASNLVKRLREIVDALSGSSAPVIRPHAPPQKRTLLGIRPPVMPDEGDRVTEDELTRVVDRPALPSKKGGPS